jgi:ABC-type multidrug transport system fused ATPase/permease subunit
MSTPTPPDASLDRSLTWFGLLKVIWSFLDTDKAGYVIWNIVAFLGIAYHRLAPPIILGKLVDFFIHYHRGDSLDLFYGYAIFLAGTYLLVSYLRLFAKNRLNRIAIRSRIAGRFRGFERIMNYSLLWHAKENMGNKVQRVLTGSQALLDFIRLVHIQLLKFVADFSGVIAVFLFIRPSLAGFFLAYVIIFLSVERFFNRRISVLSNRFNKANENSSGIYIEAANNLLSVKAMGAENAIQSIMHDREEESRYWQYKRFDWGMGKWYSFQTVNGIAFAVFIIVTGFQVLNGTLTIGTLLIVFSYFTLLRDTCGDASDMINDLIEKRSDVGRMMPLFAPQVDAWTGTEAFPARWKSLDIEHGHFQYFSGAVGITELDLTVRRGERLGIAGLSGSGKSTLVKLFLGLYNLERGSFHVGLKDFYALSHDGIMKNISVVLQETELLNFSLRNNITLMRQVEPKLLEHAVKTAQLEGVIAKLPQGLDTLVGEKGYSLSGGERQRVGIARALCKDAAITIFDEATSALDAVTEQKIMERLLGDDMGHDKTLIIIAHRLATLRNTDRIVVFEGGKIVENGTFAELAGRDESRFGQLYHLQMARTENLV